MTTIPVNVEALTQTNWLLLRREHADWCVEEKLWQLLALLNRYPYALFTKSRADLAVVDQEITSESLTDLLTRVRDEHTWIGPHLYESGRLIIEQEELLQMGINCQVGAHAVLELLGKPVPREHRSLEMSSLCDGQYTLVDHAKPWFWQVGDVVLMQKGADTQNAKALHMAVVVGANAAGVPLLFHVAARKDQAVRPASIVEATKFDGSFHRIVKVVRPRVADER